MKRSKFFTSVLVVMLLVSLSGVSAFADVVAPVVDVSAIDEETASAEESVLEEEPVAESEVSYLRFDVGSDLVFVAEDGVIVSVTTELDLNPEEPAEAVEEPAEAVEEPAEAVEEPAEAVEEPAEAVEEPAEAVEEPAEAVEEPAEAVEEPAEAVEEPAEAVEEPAEAVEEPAEAVEEPAEAVEEPAEAVEEPAEAVEEPAESADPYAEYLGLSVTEGIDLLLSSSEFDGPIKLDIFANGETADTLMTLLEEGYAEQLKLQAVALDSTDPNAERFLNAAIYRITPGKMNLLEKMGSFLDEDEMDYALWSTWSVKEIQTMAKTNRVVSKSIARENVKTNKGKAKPKNK